MNVTAINNLSLQNFEGKAKRKNNKEISYPQQNSPASKNASKAMRNLLLGSILLGATTPALTSCEDIDVWAKADADAKAWVYGIGCNHEHDKDTTVIRDTIRDTIINTEFQPVYVREFPFHISDSLINQGLNIGVNLDGPAPAIDNNDVVFVASKAYNEYDNRFYETHVDSIGTNKNTLSLVTKIVDMYDPENPKTSWMKTNATDVPGKGIKLTRYVSPSATKPEEYEWNYSGYEIRSNGARGDNKGKNIIYDNHGNMIWKGQYEKGQNPGEFMYGTVVYDNNGNPYLDEDGNPEIAHYNFSKAKMWSDRVNIEEVEDVNWGTNK